MRTRTAVGIAVVGGLALVAGRSVGLDQRVRDAVRDLIPHPAIERPADKPAHGDIPLNERLTSENFAENPNYVDFYHTNTEARHNEDPYTAGQTARVKRLPRLSQSQQAVGLYASEKSRRRS